MSGNNMVRLPEVIVFAGPNGSRKSAITQMAKVGGIYGLTSSVDINVARVQAREALGGHGVPEEKIRSRYDKALALIPRTGSAAAASCRASRMLRRKRCSPASAHYGQYVCCTLIKAIYQNFSPIKRT